MREHRFPRLGIGLEQREIHYPAEGVRRLGPGGEPANHFLPHFVERGGRHAVRTDRQEREVSVPYAELTEHLDISVLCDRSGNLFALAFYPGRSPSTNLLYLA